MKRTVLVFGVLACATTAHADPSLECSFQTETQVEVRECLTEIEENLVPAMAIVYKTAYAVAKQTDNITERVVAVPALEASQAAWEAFRDAQCNYAGSLFAGGSGTGIEIQSCRIEMTRARIKALSARVN